MHRHIYAKKIGFTMIIFVFCLGFPALTTLFLNQENGNRTFYNITDSGKYVTISAENGTSSLDVEEFIPCAMMAQLSIDDPEELLKAFSIVLRTCIYEKLGDKTSINADELELPFMTYDEMKELWKSDFADHVNQLNKIISKTSLMVITANDSLIHPYYHMLSSKTTRQGTESYLQPAYCPLDMESPDYLQTCVYSIESFLSSLKEINPQIEVSSTAPLETFQILSRDNADYVTGLKIGEIAVDVTSFTEKFALASQCFEIDAYNGGIRIVTKGIGHGYGMSLYTAKKMSLDKKNYKDILNYFYKDCVIIS